VYCTEMKWEDFPPESHEQGDLEPPEPDVDDDDHGQVYGDDFIEYYNYTNVNITRTPHKIRQPIKTKDDDDYFKEEAVTESLPVYQPHKMRLSLPRSSLPENNIIDVMVPYTKRSVCRINNAAEAKNCEITATRKRVMEDLIELAISESNVAFENSGIEGRFRLAHTYLLEDTFDEQSSSYTDVVSLIARTNDGVWDTVHNRRAQYGADVVAVIVDKGESCGLGYSQAPVSKNWAFSLVNWSCATGYYSFAHEIAHNLGLRHDRVTQDCMPDGTCCGTNGCFNFAWRDPNQRFRSIGAYNCPTTYCPRVQYFSQPDILYPYSTSNGRTDMIRIGSASNNNARIIRESWNTVANFNSPPACGNGICEPSYGENCHSCPADCIGGFHDGSGECGNGFCEAGENCLSCPSDCSGRLGIARLDKRYCCVGGPVKEVATSNVKYSKDCTWNYCNWNVECDATPSVKGAFCCGNGVCEPGETVDTCSDCLCTNDGVCDTTFETRKCADCRVLQKDSPKCLAKGRGCYKIFPDPCCNRCGGKFCL